MNLRNAILGAALLVLPAVAHAQPVAAASAPDATVNWSGPYAGVHTGYTWAQRTDSVGGADALTASNWEYPGEIASPALNSGGFIGGGQVGYNFQFAPMWVAGVEADLSWMNADKSASAAGTSDYSRIMTGTEKMDLFGTVRARFGVTPTNGLLTYVTGGLAYGHASLSTALTRTSGCGGNNCQQGSTSGTQLGWTAGAGVEWAFAANWSAKAEYLYYDLGTMSHLMTDPNFPGTVFRASSDVTGQILRVGLNYRF